MAMEIAITVMADEELELNNNNSNGNLKKVDRQLLLNKVLATHHQDNFNLLSQIKHRLHRAGVKRDKVQVRFENLKIGMEVQVGSRSLPTLINFGYDVIENVATTLGIIKSNRYPLTILNNVSGIIKPGRMTLLLGPPGSGKSTLLRALAGKLDGNLKKRGNISYNGHNVDEFYVQRTSGYISQSDNLLADLTVRETLDFAARCQASSEPFAGYIKELDYLEKDMSIQPNPDIDAFMKAASIGGKEESILSDYVLKILGLDVCSEVIVGDHMVRGISGGQRKRVTTGEMVVGPRKILLMDEISTGLDSSTTYQIVKCIGNFVREMEATVFMALLQPPPETFELFDDIILLSDGYLVYQGPREGVLDFFNTLSFQLPPCKGIADFLQEVTSKKDQAQYWADPSRSYTFVCASEFAEAFKNSKLGKDLKLELSVSYDKSQTHPLTLAKTKFAATKWELFRTCFARERLLISRHKFLYVFRTCQVAFVGFVTCTIFLGTRTHPKDENNGNLYLSCLFYGLVHIIFNGFSELPLMISRLPVFYKERDNLFYPAWAWSTSSWILRVPYSILEAVVWSCIVYYTVGFAPNIQRFFQFILLLFSAHQMALGLFCMMASITRDMVFANTFGSAALLIIFLLGGFILPKAMIKPWLSWAYWVSPLTYGQRAISVNEFTATRWMEKSTLLFGNNETVGYNILHSLSIPSSNYSYWSGVGVLFLYAILFNVVHTFSLAYLHSLMERLSKSIPRWWIWFYYVCPVSWTLRGIVSSQLGDVETMIEGPGFEGTVKQYLEVSLGYGDGMIGVSVAVLFAFIFLFFSVFATSLKLINFQKR